MSDEYEVEKIVDKRVRNGKVEYKIKWVGYSMEECTWEPLKNLENIKKMIDDYNEKINQKESQKKNSIEKFLGKKTDNPLPEEEKNNTIKNNEKENVNEEKNLPNLNDLKSNFEYNNNNLKENNNNNKHDVLNNKKNDSFFVDERYKEVFTIKREGNELCAIVIFDNNGIIEKKHILTKELQKINPFILIQFYESKIKFT
jgi:hypothetical protein